MSNWTKTPRIGDEITLNINGIRTQVVAVERTSCNDCYLYGRCESRYSRSNCFNFDGNKQDVWLECSGSYRSDKENIMFKLK